MHSISYPVLFYFCSVYMSIGIGINYSHCDLCNQFNIHVSENSTICKECQEQRERSKIEIVESIGFITLQTLEKENKKDATALDRFLRIKWLMNKGRWPPKK